MIRRLFTYRSIARLAVCLLVFASLETALSAASAQGAPRLLELTAALEEMSEPHDSSKTICHSCPDHVCLEQHDALKGSGPSALLMTATITIEPWPALEGWAHPPTAPPPRAEFIHFISLPRAPPELS